MGAMFWGKHNGPSLPDGDVGGDSFWTGPVSYRNVRKRPLSVHTGLKNAFPNGNGPPGKQARYVWHGVCTRHRSAFGKMRGRAGRAAYGA